MENKNKLSNNRSRRNFIRNSAIGIGAFFIVPRYVLGGNGYVAPSDKVNLGFIGTGKLSNYLGPSFAKIPEVNMVAASDVFEAKLQSFLKSMENVYSDKTGKNKFKGCKGYFNYEELLDRKDIDGVVIALPDHWHAKASIDAMKAGKDVYCEKPLAHTIKEGRKMVKAARKYKRVVQTGSMQRSSYNFRQAVELVWSGYIGEVTTVKVNVGDPAVPCDLPSEKTPQGLNWKRWLGPAQEREYSSVLAPPSTDAGWPMWRKYIEFGGGILSDWGAHMFDIAQWGLGMDDSGPVKFIPPTDKNAVRGLKMIYANGVEVDHEDFGRGWAVRFIGTEGTIDVSRDFLDSKPDNIAGKEIGENDKRVYFSENHYSDWLNCMKTRKRPICDVEIGHRSASVCNLANIAYQVGKPLEWDPVKEKFSGNGKANKLRTKKYSKGYKV